MQDLTTEAIIDRAATEDLGRAYVEIDASPGDRARLYVEDGGTEFTEILLDREELTLLITAAVQALAQLS